MRRLSIVVMLVSALGTGASIDSAQAQLVRWHAQGTLHKVDPDSPQGGGLEVGTKFDLVFSQDSDDATEIHVESLLVDGADVPSARGELTDASAIGDWFRVQLAVRLVPPSESQGGDTEGRRYDARIAIDSSTFASSLGADSYLMRFDGLQIRVGKDTFFHLLLSVHTDTHRLPLLISGEITSLIRLAS